MIFLAENPVSQIPGKWNRITGTTLSIISTVNYVQLTYEYGGRILHVLVGQPADVRRPGGTRHHRHTVRPDAQLRVNSVVGTG